MISGTFSMVAISFGFCKGFLTFQKLFCTFNETLKNWVLRYFYYTILSEVLSCVLVKTVIYHCSRLHIIETVTEIHTKRTMFFFISNNSGVLYFQLATMGNFGMSYTLHFPGCPFGYCYLIGLLYIFVYIKNEPFPEGSLLQYKVKLVPLLCYHNAR